MDYIAYLHKDGDSDFGVSFPDFPGCVTAGKTLEEARRMAAEALSLHITGMIEDAEEIPNPSTIDDIADDPAIKRAVAFLVPAHTERTVRINITARESQIEEIDRLARAAGLTRSAYVVQAAFKQENVRQRKRRTHRLHAKKLKEADA
jgi:predicted RNase H-like HicB family nuclease